MTDIPASVEAYAARNLHQSIHRVADRVARLADDIRRRADEVDRIGQPGRTQYGQIPGDITHEIMTALMNLNLGALSTFAAEADIARAKGE